MRYLALILSLTPVIFFTGCDVVALTKNPVVMLLIFFAVLWYVFNRRKR